MTPSGTLTAEVAVKYGRSIVVKNVEDTVAMLSHRQVQALSAVAAGRVRARWRRTYAPWFSTAQIEPECDDFGIGYGTLWGLRSMPADGPPLIAWDAEDEGPVTLTTIGAAVLAAIMNIPGTTIPAGGPR